MKRHEFKIEIDAPREKVWNTLLGETTYPEWTSVFAEGSSAETDWKKGSRALFTDGKGSGMVAMIADNKPNEFLSIKHLGMIENGVEDLESEKVKEWAGALENYTLKSVGEKTELIIHIDLNDEYKEYFEKTWPAALEKVKDIAEGSYSPA